MKWRAPSLCGGQRDFTSRHTPVAPARPVIGVLCCNEFADRPIQSVASRFIGPLTQFAGATVVLVPALSRDFEPGGLACCLDGLLLTGSRSNVAGQRYGAATLDAGPLDPERDAVALGLAERMIEAGKPVFGICRGLQELNVLFGGTLTDMEEGAHHLPGDSDFAALFEHRHAIELIEGGHLEQAVGERVLTVNSVHRQGIGSLGAGLDIEALSHGDGLVEAFSARPCGGQVLAVQWHPEWSVENDPNGQAFFRLIGSALREAEREDTAFARRKFNQEVYRLI